jgi:DNA-directed RNA polymerase specialized sigma24 family protein
MRTRNFLAALAALALTASLAQPAMAATHHKKAHAHHAAMRETSLGEHLRRLVGQLPPRQRAVVTLRVSGDLPFKEIARLEGISENSAKVSYHHAVTRLRQWLGRG